MTVTEYMQLLDADANTRAYLAQHPLLQQVPALAADIRRPAHCARGGEMRATNAWIGAPLHLLTESDPGGQFNTRCSGVWSATRVIFHRHSAVRIEMVRVVPNWFTPSFRFTSLPLHLLDCLLAACPPPVLTCPPPLLHDGVPQDLRGR